jgi:hypothetical protein
MTSGVWMLLIGFTFLPGMFCLVFALYRLTTPAGLSNVTPLPVRSTEEEKDQGPKLTKLGGPVEEVRLRA